MSISKAFILGNPRSGTSLLRIMLNTHSEILAAPESGFMQWWFDKYKDWGPDDCTDTGKVMAVADDILSSKKIETWELNKVDLLAMIREIKPESYGELCTIPYLLRAKRSGKTPRILVDKNNYYIHHLEELNEIWPDAKYIFLIRDGRDVACSYRAIKTLDSSSQYKPELPMTIEDIAHEWTQNNRKIVAFLNSYKKNDHIILRYEDLLTDPEKSLMDLMVFLGLPYESRMLEYYKYNDEPGKTLDWKKNTLKSVMSDNFGKYKHILSEDDISIFNHIAEEVLRQFDYE